MALPVLSHPVSPGAPSDFGRCGLPYNYDCLASCYAEATAFASTRLLATAVTGEVTQAIRCLADGADVNFTDKNTGETSLHRAAQRNHVALLELLLAEGADPNRRDRAHRTPLFQAAISGHGPSVQVLLAHGAQLFSQEHSSDVTQASAPPSPPLPMDEPDDAAFLALRTTCPLAAAAAAARWPVVSALLAALPPNYQQLRPALRSLRFLVWALASHKAFPRDVIQRLPHRLPACVVNSVRPAYLASTPLVLATGNDQQQLMQWLLQQGADPELGAPLLLCAGRFCRGSRTCCVNTLLRRGAAPHVAWTDNPADSPLYLAASGDCFTHVHCLVAYGADVGGEAARVRKVLYEPPTWEAHLDVLLRQYGNLVSAAAAADMLCPCGQQHEEWSGLWPVEGEEPEGGEEGTEDGQVGVATAAVEEGASGNSCYNRMPSDDAWYRHHRAQMEQLQDGHELGACRKAVDDLWAYGCSAVVSELGGSPAAPHSLMPQRVLAAMQDVAGGWLYAAARCRQQRQLRADLYDKAVAAGRVLLDRKRIAALAVLSGGVSVRQSHVAGGVDGSDHVTAEDCRQEAAAVAPQVPWALRSRGVQAALDSTPEESSSLSVEGLGLVRELRMEILALAGLAPPEVQARVLSPPARAACDCAGCRA